MRERGLIVTPSARCSSMEKWDLIFEVIVTVYRLFKIIDLRYSFT